MYSVTILTKNSQRHLHEVLSSLASFDEVIVADTGSNDDTIHIAQQFPNVLVVSLPFTGFGPTHNAASAHARFDWIFSIDSDEIATPELVKELLALKPDTNCVYSVWRKNIYKDRHIKGCGWYPDRALRIYNKNVTRFTEDLVHESIHTNNVTVVPLQNPLIHKPFHSISSFIYKIDLYSSLYAQQKEQKKSSLIKAFSHAVYAFIKCYIAQRGFLLGNEGFEIAWYNMNCAFYKYIKILEKNNNKKENLWNKLLQRLMH